MLLGLTAVSALAAFAAGAGFTHAPPVSPTGPDSSSVEHVTIVATNFAFQAPDTIKAGVVDFHLENHGTLPHHAWILRLEDGKTLEDVVKGMTHEGPLPAWMVNMGGPQAVNPGGASDATLVLKPGSYGIICVIPNAKGVPHIELGMHRPLVVVPNPAAGKSTLPPADDSVRLTNYAFLFSHPLTAGRHRLLVRNVANQTHEILFVKLMKGKTPADFAKWVYHQAGPPPGSLQGGLTGISPGLEAIADIDLPAGRYGVICFVPDAKDGRPHFMHGMITEINVK